MVSENTSDERKNTLDECINRRRNSAEYILDFGITPRSILEISELLGYKEKIGEKTHKTTIGAGKASYDFTR